MVKAHTPINWQNKPSVNTPINETNLNKMDSTIGILDDRIIAHDTSKLDKSTANTMVKDVTFNESTGIFTITYLNGSTKTLDTKLEKIATNFKYDYSTQTLILTLIDGTTQSIDMSALLTQYEFTDSATLDFSVDSSGKITATIKNGSITEDMLEPNYLANIKVETAKSAQSMANAKISENNAKQSELNAKASEEKALEYSNNAQPLAQSVSGTNPTATNSTNAPLIYGKFGGYTLQDGEPTPDNPIDIQGLGDSGTIEVKTCGKNLIEKVKNGVYPLTSANGVLWAYEQACATEQYINVGFNKQYTLSCSLSNWTCNVACYDVNKGFVKNIAQQKTFTIDDENIKYIRLGVWNNENVAFDDISVQLELGDTATDYEPYTETTATIPIDTLYEGDYLEVYADGSGKIYRVNKEIYVSELTIFFVGDTLTNTQMVQFNRPSDMKKRETKYYCDRFTYIKGTLWDNDTLGLCSSIEGLNYNLMSFRIPVGSDGNVYFTDNPTKIVYPLENPIETPLTAKQVEQFKKLYTFDNVTNFFCDGELTARYYCNTDSGDTVGMIQETVDGLQKTVKEIPDTYTTQSDFDRIVGGTVSDSGLTNVSYIVPNEISDGSMSFDSYTSGTLVDALRKATNQITMFLGTLFEEGDKSVVFENDSVAGTLEVFRHKLSEGTYLLDIKVTITSITETLSGNGPSVDLTLQDIGFEDNIIAIRESECLLASYYPLIVNGSSYCLGGGMVSTENSTKGFYLRFLPHKNTKGSISSNNKSVLSGTMMIKVVEQQL